GVGPKNTSVINRKEYTTLKVLATMAASGSQALREPKPAASAKNISFDKKPFNKGTPAMAAAATMANVAVTGISLRSHVSCRKSRVPLSWSIIPAAINKDALKVAWLSVWNNAATAASGVPMPSNSVIKPKWLIVEYANK